MHKHRLTTLLLPLSLAVAAHASDNVYTLDDVVVTATRTAQTVDQTLASVSVITREDIAKSQATNVPELLQKLPGVQVRTNGGPGSTTSLFIRGTSSKQSIVLVDGLRIGSATSGTASIQFMNPEQIERIEVVRGPKASLYGADAVGGVINIITRKDAGPSGASFNIGYGSRNTRTAGANLSASNETTSYYFGVSRLLTDGYNRTNKEVFPETDKDAYDNTSVALKADHKFNNRLSANISLSQNQGTTFYDAYQVAGYDPRSNFTKQAFSGAFKYLVNDAWISKLTLGYNRDENKDSKDAPPYGKTVSEPSKFETQRNLINWQNDFALGENTLVTAGLDYYRDRVDSTLNYEENSRDNKAVFVQGLQTFEKADLQVAFRHDDNQRYGSENTGNIALGFNLPANFRLITSYGTAFQAPSFNDLYYPSYGTPDLKPEKSKNYEIELRKAFNSSHISLSAFENRIDNLISYQKEQNKNKAISIEEAKIRGIEIAAAYRYETIAVKGSLTILDPKEVRKDSPDRYLQKRAKQLATLGVSQTLGDLTLGADMVAQSKTFSYSSDVRKTETDGFATFNLYSSYKINSEFTTGLKVVNLLDKEYETSANYREEPRGIFATLTWSPEI